MTSHYFSLLFNCCSSTRVVDDCAAVLQGGSDDISALQLWDSIMRQYGVKERCDEEIAALSKDSNFKDQDAAASLQRERAVAVAATVDALRRLVSKEMREKLEAADRHLSQNSVNLTITHKSDMLSNFHPDFWGSCFVDLFPRGDCQERSRHRRSITDDEWAMALVTRADFRRWRRSFEFVACLYNVLLRRNQLRAVSLWVTRNVDQVEKDFSNVTHHDIVAQMMASGECDSVRALLKKKGQVDDKLQKVFHAMNQVQRNVRGSEAEKDVLSYRFNAMRIWNGFSSLFFTLNPNDVKSPITLTMVDNERFHTRKFSLDMSDLETDTFLSEALRDRPRLLHEMVAQDPLAATMCFHYTVRLVIDTLFSCSAPGVPYPDGCPAHVVPGVFGHIAGYLGVVEPQMRKALHIHMLIQLHGFSHPNDLFNGDTLVNAFRRIWHYVASIFFRSVEGFAAYTCEASAKEVLRSKPIIPLKPKQRGMIGEERVRESILAQLKARGISEEISFRKEDREVRYFVPSIYNNASVSSADFAGFASAEVNAGTLKTGNHVCRPDVCHKGRLAKLGFCRMFFWHWVQFRNSKGQVAAKRSHGLPLQPRWNGEGPPPICSDAPRKGLPALEVNHPFHFKMTPSMLLGPRCNHDLGVLLRLPVLPPSLFDDENHVDTKTMEQSCNEASEAMIDAMIDHEFYCSNYASKDQPHIEGLLQTLIDGVRGLDREIAERAQRDERLEGFERGKRLLNRLISSTNRRMHKGYPEMLSYLLKQPSFYCSHTFVSLMFHHALQSAGAHVRKLASGQSTGFIQSVVRPVSGKQINANSVEDYIFRPLKLQKFSWYFFVAACDATKESKANILPWREYGNVRHPCYYQGTPVRSSVLACSLQENGEPIRRYPYHVVLRTHTAWRVPMLLGGMPHKPAKDATEIEKGTYALFIMLLFRAWQGYECVDFLQRLLGDYKDGMAESLAWTLVYKEYLRWREQDIDAKARPYLNKGMPCGKEPAFDTDEWWACMTSVRLRNVELATHSLRSTPYSAPSDIDGLPVERNNATHVGEQQDEHGNGGEDEVLSNVSNPPDNWDNENTFNEYNENHHNDHADAGNYPPLSSSLMQRCGVLPAGIVLDDLLQWPARPLTKKRISAENNYLYTYAATLQDAQQSTDEITPRIVRTNSSGLTLLSSDAIRCFDSQQQFLKDVDAYQEDINDKLHIPSTNSKDPAKQSVWEQKLSATVQELGGYVPSPTIVIETACYFLQSGLFNIPDTGKINVKAGRALMLIAQWLQERMLVQWARDDVLGVEVPSKPLFDEHILILIGAGGTGKTTVLRAAEALVDHFAGPESVRKCAISNTAARLLHGDTLHALCKLTFYEMNTRAGRLTSKVLKKHRARWRTAEAMFLDEISMVAPDQLCESDIRLRQAKEKPDTKFGGLLTLLSGDFLQLPPVRKQTLAAVVDDAGFVQKDPVHFVPGEDEEDEQCAAQIRQGLELWRSFSNVVSFETNIRAPGILSRLQLEMREGSISDEMWNLYMSRVLQPNDVRLTQKPFSTSRVHYLVHRHSIRARQSFTNAVAECRAKGKPLFIVQAADVVKDEDAAHFTPAMRKDLLSMTNPRHTKSLPGVLPLYEGMYLSLYSKDCVRLGLMNGCDCVLERIIFADEEELPTDVVAGEPITLEYLPISLLLRAVNVPWSLATNALPRLPANMRRQGLFQLRPTSRYLRRKVAKDEFINIRRTQLATLPADTKVVHSAQGYAY